VHLLRYVCGPESQYNYMKSIAIVALLGVLLFTRCAVFAQDKLRAAFGSLAASHMVLLVAKDLRFFNKYNLDAEVVGHIPGAKAVFPLISGDAQIVHAAGPPFVQAALGGSDVVMFMGLINSMSFYIVAHRDITTPAQLKGKRLGVSTLGSSSDFSLRFGLRWLGLDSENDVTILALGDSAIRVNALVSGTIQGGAYNLGETIFLKQQGHRQFLDTAMTRAEYQHTAVATTRAVLGRNRGAVVNYTRAIVEGMAWMKNNKEESLKMMSKYLRIGDRQTLEAQYEENVNKLFVKKPYPTLAGIKTILESLPRNEKARSAKAEQFVDLSIVRELDDSGFIDGLYGR
jgi:ABC-type nitrate/sulfonate/bicarbonate transport system substrate-binding protein